MMASGILRNMTTSVQALALQDLRKRKSVKWRQFPNDVLPLPVAEMDFPIAEPIKIALRDMIDRSDTGYLGLSPKYVGIGTLMSLRCALQQMSESAL
jgi:bifunctional pyridoxal-dependent enzyme with beta-cystathionase and maltose regulon repressor activities